MQIITENNLPINILNHPEIPELRDLVTDLMGDIQDFIEAPDSPLGDLSAVLTSISYHATEEQCTATLIFDISECELPGSIELAAREACTADHALPYIMGKSFDMPFGKFQYIVTGTTLVFTASYEF